MGEAEDLWKNGLADQSWSSLLAFLTLLTSELPTLHHCPDSKSVHAGPGACGIPFALDAERETCVPSRSISSSVPHRRLGPDGTELNRKLGHVLAEADVSHDPVPSDSPSTPKKRQLGVSFLLSWLAVPDHSEQKAHRLSQVIRNSK